LAVSGVLATSRWTFNGVAARWRVARPTIETDDGSLLEFRLTIEKGAEKGSTAYFRNEWFKSFVRITKPDKRARSQISLSLADLEPTEDCGLLSGSRPGERQPSEA